MQLNKEVWHREMAGEGLAEMIKVGSCFCLFAKPGHRPEKCVLHCSDCANTPEGERHGHSDGRKGYPSNLISQPRVHKGLAFLRAAESSTQLHHLAFHRQDISGQQTLDCAVVGVDILQATPPEREIAQVSYVRSSNAASHRIALLSRPHQTASESS